MTARLTVVTRLVVVRLVVMWLEVRKVYELGMYTDLVNKLFKRGLKAARSIRCHILISETEVV